MNYRVVYFILALALPALAAAQGQTLTPAEIGIQKAQAQIAKQPRYVPAYSSLAMAYARRARETSDVQFYQKAEDTLRDALKMEPENFEALRVRAWLLLGRHEFAKALEAAKGLNKRSPDDVMVYGYLVDANAELGNYSDAVNAAQWMLNLRPGNVAGLTRAAYLRELHGDISGALDLMQSAYDSTPYQESEDRAWLLTQMAHLQFVSGNLAEAEKYATGALGVFPDYHYALGTLAQVRTAQHRYDEAATLLEKRYSAAPHAENLYSLAEALAHAGRADEAARDFAEFERKSLAESQIADNSNHELMAYYNDFAHQPEKALKIAEQELKRRHDVFTLDGYAWSLAGMGDYAAAEIQMKQALATGIKDPKILDHARIISEGLTRRASLKD
ncbi:MAG TPA: tetratricopeptide repeat protein [Bryobacteraceae bacterium]|nr:tetratricopeptide repeat protein [Bryobacteraceae bacterium]